MRLGRVVPAPLDEAVAKHDAVSVAVDDLFLQLLVESPNDLLQLDCFPEFGRRLRLDEADLTSFCETLI